MARAAAATRRAAAKPAGKGASKRGSGTYSGDGKPSLLAYNYAAGMFASCAVLSITLDSSRRT